MPVGGGKDSIVTIECLEAGRRAAGAVLARQRGADRGDDRAGRTARDPRDAHDWIPALFALNEAGALNGHVPITGILSMIVLACAIIHGFDAIAMSNEHSASAPNIADVNHQYSKSFEFEQAFSRLLERHVVQGVRYFSLLRPLSEVAIARRFARHAAYLPVFRSCNTAFRQSPERRGTNWCCDCPKCRFVFLALAPFVERQRLIATFGRDMLDDPAQTDGFAELCGLQRHKPFECVGEIEESATVMAHLADDGRMARRRGGACAVAATAWRRLAALFVPRGPHLVPRDIWRCSMRVDELRGRRIAIWGFAREGRAALRFLRERDPGMAITVLDDAERTCDAGAPLISGRAAIAAAIGSFDVVVKSPGISLYDPLVVKARAEACGSPRCSICGLPMRRHAARSASPAPRARARRPL